MKSHCENFTTNITRYAKGFVDYGSLIILLNRVSKILWGTSNCTIYFPKNPSDCLKSVEAINADTIAIFETQFITIIERNHWYNTNGHYEYTTKLQFWYGIKYTKKQMYMTQNTELLMCKVTHKLVDQNNEKSGW